MFDDAINRLSELSRRAQRIDGEHEVPLADVFTDEFMLRHTDFSSIDEFLDATGRTIRSADEFDALTQAELDALTVNHSRFESWDALKAAAAEQRAIRQLGFDN